MKVLAALSGGVDSAVATARAVDAGHDVTGIQMVLSHDHERVRAGIPGCCSFEDSGEARRVAEAIGIPFEVWDLSEEFEDEVIAYFLSEYAAGRTPNPCVRCNQCIKFGVLCERAEALGFEAVSTGHYARVIHRIDGGKRSFELHRAVDVDKDQSYVLAALGRGRLERVLFPLGEVASKNEVRKEAAARGFEVSAKPDSYDVCFIRDGDVAGFLRRRLGDVPGDIVDEEGVVVGEHRGAYAFTVGQRKGLRLPRPAADGEPRYVTEVRMATNTVVVGPEGRLSVSTLHGTDVVWLAEDITTSGDRGTGFVPCLLQVRAHGVPAPARVAVEGSRMLVELDEPMRGVAVGQSLVVYDGTRVLGQATAERS